MVGSMRRSPRQWRVPNGWLARPAMYDGEEVRAAGALRLSFRLSPLVIFPDFARSSAKSRPNGAQRAGLTRQVYGSAPSAAVPPVRAGTLRLALPGSSRRGTASDCRDWFRGRNGRRHRACCPILRPFSAIFSGSRFGRPQPRLADVLGSLFRRQPKDPDAALHRRLAAFETAEPSERRLLSRCLPVNAVAKLGDLLAA
jgi:hypothetical protein